MGRDGASGDVPTGSKRRAAESAGSALVST